MERAERLVHEEQEDAHDTKVKRESGRLSLALLRLFACGHIVLDLPMSLIRSRINIRFFCHQTSIPISFSTMD
jgi:hypothetical protein